MTALDQIKALDKQMLRMVQEAETPDSEKPKDVLIPDDAGTPLYYAQVETETPRRRNSLAQAVENSRRAAEKPEKRTEKKKADKAQAGTKPVVEAAAPKAEQSFSEMLKNEWKQSEDREKLTASILSLSGAREQFAKALGGTADPVLAALKAQLQDTEAERLMTVMNLNQAKAQEAQYRETLVAGLVKSERKELDKLRSDIEEAKALLKETKDQQTVIINENQRIAEESVLPCIWAGESSEDVQLTTIAKRVTESLQTAGFRCDMNDAYSLLTVFRPPNRLSRR